MPALATALLQHPDYETEVIRMPWEDGFFRLAEHTSETLEGTALPEKIKRAWYGSQSARPWSADQGADVTARVASLLATGKAVQASNDLFGDPAPGAEKVLLLEGGGADGREGKRHEPLARCPGSAAGGKPSRASGEADTNLQQAVSLFCNAGLGSLVEFYVDPRFESNHRRLQGPDGWIDKAYVSFMGLRSARDKIAAEEDLLVQSIRHFSDRPLVVANFGRRVPRHWDPERYPNLVLMHGRSSTTSIGKSFNFNKLTAMLFSKVKSGLVLDADQFANRGLDSMLQRASEETTAEYPYPIMPVHWMSRDPTSDDMAGYPYQYSWHFKSKDAPPQKMRWGHAHPTWSHEALPWLARWTSYALAPERAGAPGWLKEQGWIEDEDLMNVALWADGATKQWCKYDMTSPDMFGSYLDQKSDVSMMRDRKYYPKGIAYIYFTAHDAKKPQESYDWLSKLWNDGDDTRKAILYDGRWFGSGKALKAYDPTLKCTA